MSVITSKNTFTLPLLGSVVYKLHLKSQSVLQSITYSCNRLQTIHSTGSGEGRRMRMVNFRNYNFWYVLWELYWSVKESGERVNPTEIHKGKLLQIKANKKGKNKPPQNPKQTNKKSKKQTKQKFTEKSVLSTPLWSYHASPQWSGNQNHNSRETITNT